MRLALCLPVAAVVSLSLLGASSCDLSSPGTSSHTTANTHPDTASDQEQGVLNLYLPAVRGVLSQMNDADSALQCSDRDLVCRAGFIRLLHSVEDGSSRLQGITVPAALATQDASLKAGLLAYAADLRQVVALIDRKATIPDPLATKASDDHEIIRRAAAAMPNL